MLAFMTQITSNEQFGRMVNDAWNEHDPDSYRPWDSVSEEERKAYGAIGKALYDAGFEAGADSMISEKV